MVLVYVEPCGKWQEVYVADAGIVTAGRAQSTVLDLKRVVASGFDHVSLDDEFEKKILGLTVTEDMIEVRQCEGSFPKGDFMENGRSISNGKWYYITCNRALDELRALEGAARLTQAAEDDLN
eukprot:9496519-Pyramimonas_sp.AAC.1